MTEWPDSPVGARLTDVIYPPTPLYESKSPMKYAVDYKLVDEDGNVMKDTDYFLLKDEAWARATELYELSGLQGAITFREL